MSKLNGDFCYIIWFDEDNPNETKLNAKFFCRLLRKRGLHAFVYSKKEHNWLSCAVFWRIGDSIIH